MFDDVYNEVIDIMLHYIGELLYNLLTACLFFIKDLVHIYISYRMVQKQSH